MNQVVIKKPIVVQTTKSPVRLSALSDLATGGLKAVYRCEITGHAGKQAA